ncbi:MAG: DLW-39 family protein [Nocardioidaceae bacterium]
MLKKLFAVAIVGVIAKVVLDKLTHGNKDAELWAEATDTVEPRR